MLYFIAFFTFLDSSIFSGMMADDIHFFLILNFKFLNIFILQFIGKSKEKKEIFFGSKIENLIDLKFKTKNYLSFIYFSLNIYLYG